MEKCEDMHVKCYSNVQYEIGVVVLRVGTKFRKLPQT